MNFDPLGLVSKYALPLLGGALALSAIGNVTLGLVARHYMYARHDCVEAVKTVNKTAEHQKAVVITRDQTVVKQTSVNIKSAVADVTTRVRDYSRSQHSGTTTQSTQGVGGTSTDTIIPSPPFGFIIIPESDGIICAINTVKASEWQQFYSNLQEVRAQEYGTDTKSGSLLGISGGTHVGVLPRYREYVDLGVGSDGRLRPYSREVQGQAEYVGGSSLSLGVVDSTEVPSDGTESIQGETK